MVNNGCMRWRGISSESQPQSHLPLAVQLREIRENTERYAPPETIAIHERAIAELHSEAAAQRAVKPGDAAPPFTLNDHNGRLVRSSELLGSGPLVALFFQGRWSPYCMTQLEAMQFAYPEIKARGAALVAISPQKLHHNLLAAEQHRLQFPLLSDPGNRVAATFGIRYRVPQEQLELYRRIVINLASLNYDAPDTLPLASVFIIHPNGPGLIGWSRADEDFRVRPEPADVLAAL